MVDEHGRWTFAELEDAARRAAGALRDAGVSPGDRVLVALRDGRPWVQAFLGAAALGAVAPLPITRKNPLPKPSDVNRRDIE